MSSSDIVCGKICLDGLGASSGRTSPCRSGRSVYTAVMERRERDLWCGAYNLGELLLCGHYN